MLSFLYFENGNRFIRKWTVGNLTPCIEWHLSEIVAPIILNDKRIQRLLKKRARFILSMLFKLPDKQSKNILPLYMRRMKKKKGIEVFLKRRIARSKTINSV